MYFQRCFGVLQRRAISAIGQARMMSSRRRIGVFGGSGMYDMEGVSVQETKRLSTPFGAPSDDYTIAQIDGNDKIKVVFLPRHGRGHTVTPSEINYRANVFGMKSLGVEWIVSVTAVGSLCENKSPGEMA